MSNDSNPDNGCLIVINGELIDHHDVDSLEQALDHEMNHYFKQFETEQKDIENFIFAMSLIKSIIQ